MPLVVTHTKVTGASADPNAIVDGPAWDATHTISGSLSPSDIITTVQYLTAGSTVTVQSSDSLIIVNKSVGSATTVNLPPSQTKNGNLKIVDFKGDAATNNITINCSGSDTFNGGLTTWTIAANGASVILHPVVSNGIGYGYAI